MCLGVSFSEMVSCGREDCGRIFDAPRQSRRARVGPTFARPIERLEEQYQPSLIGCTPEGVPSHMPARVQARAKGRDIFKVVPRAHHFGHLAVICGWSASRGNPPSRRRQEAPQTGPIRRRLESRSN